MSSEQNKALVLRFYEEVWNKGNYEAADEIMVDGERYDQGQHGPNSAALQKTVARNFRSAFPDAKLQAEVVIAEGEWVAARWRMSATHASGSKIYDYTAVNLFRMVNGKVIEIRNNRDDLTLFHQLGLVPSPQDLWQSAGGHDEKAPREDT